MLYSLSLSFLYQRDKEAVLLWIAGIIPLESLYYISDFHAKASFSGASALMAYTPPARISVKGSSP